jgi:hypothetical protein
MAATCPIRKVAIVSDKDVVHSIYLGSRIAEMHKRRIVTALRSSEIRIYEMDVNDDYTHKWQRIQTRGKGQRT